LKFFRFIKHIYFSFTLKIKLASGADLTLSDEDVHKLIDLVDQNGDGKLTCEEFIKLL
jgi:Ca2+-binding EF-hand superfamily protein